MLVWKISLVVDGDTHLITETRDSFGRSSGFVYSKNGTIQHTVTTGYGTDGRISSAGFTHGGAVKQFGYEYLTGTNLLHKLTKPNNMTFTQTYEATRNLLTSMAYHRGTTLIAQRTYSYDILGRPTARNTARNGQIVNDTFAHNTRSELVEAQVNGTDYEYAYDNIGNRQQATEGNDVTVYDANELNQYTSIRENGSAAFVPQFDADGNQTLIQTDTGIWSAVYNAENRPVTFTNSESNTVVECQYDSMGRRAFKQVTVNGSVTLHQRYIYRGYLQLACIDLTRSHHPVMWLVTWDSTQPVATRPLAIRINGTWYTYGWDLTKNVCELYSTEGRITTSYTYSPFGSVTATGSHTQPIQWSSEMWDSELGLVYYNWRYYNSIIGRWISYDPANYLDLYFYLNPTWEWDNLGLRPDINYLSKAFKKDVLSEFDSAEVYINEPSYFVITAHGTAHFITDSDNNLMSPLELANKMIEAGYRFDKTVKLLACNTGKLKNGFAQQLANHLYLIWKKSYQHIKKPHIIINAPETLTIISYFDDKDRRFYKIYSAEETPFISINPITNENIVEYRSELILKSFKPCK